MSEIQNLCIIALILMDAIFNIVGWLNICTDIGIRDINKPLLIVLISVDALTVILLILGAIGVFG